MRLVRLYWWNVFRSQVTNTGEKTRWEHQKKNFFTNTHLTRTWKNRKHSIWRRTSECKWIFNSQFFWNFAAMFPPNGEYRAWEERRRTLTLPSFHTFISWLDSKIVVGVFTGCSFNCSQYCSIYFVQLNTVHQSAAPFFILKKWTRCLNLRADERQEGTIFILKRLKTWAHLHLGGTAKTSGWSWAKPTGSPSRLSRVSTHVWTGLRWAGTMASHFLRTGREQSAGGGGRSAGGQSSQ